MLRLKSNKSLFCYNYEGIIETNNKCRNEFTYKHCQLAHEQGDIEWRTSIKLIHTQLNSICQLNKLEQRYNQKRLLNIETNNKIQTLTSSSYYAPNYE